MRVSELVKITGHKRYATVFFSGNELTLYVNVLFNQIAE